MNEPRRADLASLRLGRQGGSARRRTGRGFNQNWTNRVIFVSNSEAPCMLRAEWFEVGGAQWRKLSYEARGKGRQVRWTDGWTANPNRIASGSVSPRANETCHRVVVRMLSARGESSIARGRVDSTVCPPRGSDDSRCI